MSIGGWKTRSVFERYAIVNRLDIADAMKKLPSSEAAQQTVVIGHELVTIGSARPANLSPKGLHHAHLNGNAPAN
jgi:hypothetical protein